MGIIAKLSPKAQAPTVTFDPMNHDMVRRAFGTMSSAGKSVNDDTALSISAAWCCRKILSESIGMLPWGMFRKEPDGNATRVADHWLEDVLVWSPNRDQTSVEFRESLTLGLTGDGNAYSFIESAANRVTSLVPMMGVTPDRKRGSNTQLKIADGDIFYRYNDRGRPVDLPREKVWHVKGFGHDSLRGLSPIMAARQAMGGALAQEEFANLFFAQGGMPAGVVTYPGWLNADQKVQAKEALDQMVGGLGNSHKMALFQGGMKPEPWSTMNLEEMQFIVARRFSVLEICRFYRVPPHMVAELEKGASYASIEQMSQEFVMFTLMPYLTRYEASVSRWLIPANERRRYFIRFNFEGLLRADSKSRAEMYASAVQNGWMNRNEVRAKENLNNVAGLDEFTAQMNLTTVEKLGADAPEPKAPQQPAQDRVTVIRAETPAAPPPEPKMNITLPEGLAKQMKYSVDHPAVREVLALIKAFEDRTNTKIQDLEHATRVAISEHQQTTQEAIASGSREISAISAAVAEGIERMQTIAMMPRKPVFHSDGEIAGAVPVDKLELH